MAPYRLDGRSRGLRPLRSACVSLTIALGLGPEAAADEARTATAPPDLTQLSPEQLSQLEVTSVSKKPEKRWRSPAAIHVITREDIRRSGVTSIVEALRLAPGVVVGRINAHQWAVGVRGFASSLTRSVLVMIDGRSVYTPLFAGTYWDVQDTLLEDVERIEVIRGPGGSLWGANAVNGVINIITRSSRETQGAFATLGGGTSERGQAGFRYGGASGPELTYRVFAKAFDRGPSADARASDFDDWRMGQAGFRTDWERGSSDTVKVQGDVYRGDAGVRASLTRLTPPSIETVEADARLQGGNLQARWRHVGASGTEWALRTYYDHTDRREPTFSETRHTLDFDLQRRAAHGRHDLVVGLGYRLSSGTAEGTPGVAFVPPRRTDHLWTGFFRDELSFAEGRLMVAAGSKLEHNGYSGFEVQPTVQALWAPTPRQSVWLAAARQVRTPSRVEHDLALTSLVDASTPAFAEIVGNQEFGPEKIQVAEIGHRLQAGPVALDTVAFYNSHRDLLSVERGPPRAEGAPRPRLVFPFVLGNGTEGSSYGVEVTADWTARDGWRFFGSYAFLRLSLKSSPGSLDTTTAESTNGTAPRHKVVAGSRVDLAARASVDLIFRWVDDLPAPEVPGYASLDARLAWRPHATLELALVGQNLLDPRHPEFAGSGGSLLEVRRGVYGTLTWRP